MFHGPEHYRKAGVTWAVNVTVLSGVTRARTLPSIPLLHGPERYRYDGVTWAVTLLLRPVLHGPEHYRYDQCYIFLNDTVLSSVTPVSYTHLTLPTRSTV